MRLSRDYLNEKYGEPAASEQVEQIDQIQIEATYDRDSDTSEVAADPFGVGADIDVKKFVTVALMFMLMFVLPLGLYTNRNQISEFTQSQYQSATADREAGNATTPAPGQEGRVAGVATASSSVGATSTSEIAGIPISTLFVALGIFTLTVPVYLIAKA